MAVHRFIVQKTCFGFRNSYWRIGKDVWVSDEELPKIPKHFVKPENFVMPNGQKAGGPNIELISKTTQKQLETGMPPATREHLISTGEMITHQVNELDIPVAKESPAKDKREVPLSRGRKRKE